MNSKAIASVSIDLDDEWTYLKIHGEATWSSFPSYLDVLVPRVLEFLKRRELTVTFFVVGQDAAFDRNLAALRSIASAGHEIGNHSFNHEPWLHRYSEDAIEREVALAEAHIQRATERTPVGFRGPGFSFSASLLRVLSQRGYRYDASTLPTFIGPLARSYYFMKSRLPKEEIRQRSELFGSFAEGLRPNTPYRWRLGDRELLEIPVTTMPGLRLPIHLSYILYIAGFSHMLALFYFRLALALCKLTGTEPSLLLHPLDFLGREDNQSLAFFPGMGMSRATKLALVGDVIEILARERRIVTMAEHAEVAWARCAKVSRYVESESLSSDSAAATM